MGLKLGFIGFFNKIFSILKLMIIENMENKKSVRRKNFHIAHSPNIPNTLGLVFPSSFFFLGIFNCYGLMQIIYIGFFFHLIIENRNFLIITNSVKSLPTLFILISEFYDETMPLIIQSLLYLDIWVVFNFSP